MQKPSASAGAAPTPAAAATATLVATTSAPAVTVTGGFHLVPFLDQRSDALVAAGRMTKLGKAVPAPTSGGAGTPAVLETEYALCTHATLKLRLVPDPAAASGAAKWTLAWRQSHAFVRRLVPMDVPHVTPSGAKEGKPARGTLAVPPKPVLVVEFFSEKPSRKVASASAAASSSSPLSSLPAVVQSAYPELRRRFLEFSSPFARDEWLVLFQSALTNYWHERLEKSVILAPEIYQYHAYAVCTSSSQADKLSNFEPGGPGKRWCQVALSTTKLYVIARPTKEQFHSDTPVGAPPPNVLTFFAAGLGSVTLTAASASVKVSNKSGEQWCELQFMERGEATQFIVELQRIWEMVGGAGGSGAAAAQFPVVVA